ncbi:DNA double-strand break repair nuclease NurA [Thermococcus peptonophilus]|uniref:5'-3' exonuclease n=1 Tax=Thermococcus peptonophilus TaxID=53952 RepID=A0A142CUJ6_9EURY|nr:DNA double-strand break repair nuclease NurA [Thermococcus peptonophilus]AMQ18448.1 5'-3' exonuclease [Thermococcus peptonophilus]
MYRLIDRKSVDRIKALLERGYREAESKLAEIEWRSLPKERKQTRVYAVDGSQGKQRLSGTIFYAVSSYAFGNGPAYRLVYTNAMLYNQGISDQIIRLQMETLENKLGYLSAKLGDVDYVMMDGTLTGSLTRPPVYPESVRGINALEALLKDKFSDLITEFLDELDRNYENLMNALEESQKAYSGVILADELLNKFVKKYASSRLLGYARKIRISSCETLPEKIPIPLEYLEENSDKTVQEILNEIKKKYCKKIIIEDIRDAIHVVLSYLEYLYSLDKLLSDDMALIYLAKSFYNKSLAKQVKLDIVDVAYLDAFLKKRYGGELPGYYRFPKRTKVEHSIPDVLSGVFKNVEEMITKGVPSAYIRTMKGGVIYLLQSNRDIDDELLSGILWHESSGYFRPLQRAHEGVKIEKKAFEAELKALLNIIKAESPELRVFLKYGRSPLE